MESANLGNDLLSPRLARQRDGGGELDGSVDYYGAWNGARGYLHFYGFNGGTDFSNGLYYVHGRWWNPATGLFMSPDDKGEYFYGSGQDAVNWVWEFVGGAGTQIILTNADALAIDVHVVYPNEQLYQNYINAREQFEYGLPDTTAYRTGRIVGGIATVVQGIGEAGIGFGVGTGGTVAGCLVTVEVGCLPGAGAAVLTGAAVTAHGATVAIVGASETGHLVRVLFAKLSNWGVGEPPNKLDSEGSYPDWETVRQRYWMNRAQNAKGELGPSNIARMKKGLAPVARIIARIRDTGQQVEMVVSKELHHISGRGGIDPHDLSNLQELWPWEHEAIDPSRHLNWDFIQFK